MNNPTDCKRCSSGRFGASVQPGLIRDMAAHREEPFVDISCDGDPDRGTRKEIANRAHQLPALVALVCSITSLEGGKEGGEGERDGQRGRERPVISYSHPT